MRNCRLCKEAFNLNHGLKGDKADKTKLMLVLHRADNRIHEYLEGYWGALMNSATGITLDKMLKRADLDFQDVYLTNFFKCLLPRDRHPTKEEYLNCSGILESQVRGFLPSGIVLFGNEAYRHVFPESARKTRINQADSELDYRGVPTLVSMHPSQVWKKLNPELQEPYIRRVSEFLKRYKR